MLYFQLFIIVCYLANKVLYLKKTTLRMALSGAHTFAKAADVTK